MVEEKQEEAEEEVAKFLDEIEQKERKRAILSTKSFNEVAQFPFLERVRMKSAYSPSKLREFRGSRKDRLWYLQNKIIESHSAFKPFLLKLVGYRDTKITTLEKNKERLRAFGKRVLVMPTDAEIDKMDVVSLLHRIVDFAILEKRERPEKDILINKTTRGQYLLKVPPRFAKKLCYNRRGELEKFVVFYIYSITEKDNMGHIHYIPLDTYRHWFPWLFSDLRDEYISKLKKRYPKAKSFETPPVKSNVRTVSMGKNNYLSIPLKSVVYPPPHPDFPITNSLGQLLKNNLAASSSASINLFYDTQWCRPNIYYTLKKCIEKEKGID